MMQKERVISTKRKAKLEIVLNPFTCRDLPLKLSLGIIK
jgi:hypothetical protein